MKTFARRSIRIFVAAVVASVVCFCGAGGNVGASAGTSKNVIAADSSIANGIASNVWVNQGDVKGEKGCIVFDADVEADAHIVAMGKVKDVSGDGFEKNLEATYKVKIDNINEGARLVFAFGLSRLSSAFGSDGSGEVYFVWEAGAYKIGVSSFDDGGEKQIVSPRTVNGLTGGKSFVLSVSVEKSAFIVSVQPDGGASVPVCDASVAGNEIGAEGYVGIGQIGKCSAEISSVNITSYEYLNASTPASDISSESFEGGAYNGNVWYSFAQRGQTGGGVFVEDERLVFRGLTNGGYFGTKYQYSNFVLTFDLVHVQRTTETDENGELLYRKENNGWFGVSLGQPAYNERNFNIATECMFTLHPDASVKRYTDGSVADSSNLQMKGMVDFWKESYEGEIFNFRFEAKDGVFRLSCRRGNTGSYIELMSYSTDSTPYGYVRILAYGVSNVIFDNVEIENTDTNGDLLVTGYKANGLEGAEDYVYTDTWSDKDLLPWARKN